MRNQDINELECRSAFGELFNSKSCHPRHFPEQACERPEPAISFNYIA